MNTSLTIREFPFAQQTLAALYLGNNMENNWPVVYQINNKNEIYIGETTNLKVLLSRSIKGTYVYVCDPQLREYLSQFFQVID